MHLMTHVASLRRIQRKLVAVVSIAALAALLFPTEKHIAFAATVQTINDCPNEHCPDMVVIPASPPGFKIGSPPDEPGRLPSEKLHPVNI